MEEVTLPILTLISNRIHFFVVVSFLRLPVNHLKSSGNYIYYLL